MSQPAQTTTAPAGEFVAFCVGDQEYCIDILSVREIRGWTPVTALPGSPSYVRGLINLRGAVVPIVDLASRLDLPPPEPTARHVIIVSQVADKVVGLLVDAVSDILTIPSDRFQPTPDVASTAAKAFVQGVIAIEERMIRLLSLDRLLPKQKDAA